MTQMTEIEAVEVEDLAPYVENNDPKMRTHIVRQHENADIYTPGMTGQDIVDMARLLGIEVTALCGHRWIPMHNPEKYDICETCKQLWTNITEMEG